MDNSLKMSRENIFKLITPSVLSLLTVGFAVFGYFYQENEKNKGLLITRGFTAVDKSIDETKSLILRLEQKVDTNQLMTNKSFEDRDYRNAVQLENTWLWRNSIERRVSKLEKK